MTAQSVQTVNNKTAEQLWAELKPVHKQNLAVVCCLAPFMPAKHNDMPRILNMIINDRSGTPYSRYMVAGTLLAKQSRKRVVSFLKRMVAAKRSAIEIFTVIRGILLATPFNSPKQASLWRFLCDYVDSLESSDLPDSEILDLPYLIGLFHRRGQPLADIITNSINRVLSLKSQLMSALLDVFSARRLVTGELIEFFAGLSNTFANLTDRAIFLALVSERATVKIDKIAKLLRDTITEMANCQEIDIDDIRRVAVHMSEYARNSVIWDEISKPIIDLISNIKDPQKKLETLGIVSPLIAPRLESYICSIVEEAANKLN